jgi:hypothetical protein
MNEVGLDGQKIPKQRSTPLNDKRSAQAAITLHARVRGLRAAIHVSILSVSSAGNVCSVSLALPMSMKRSDFGKVSFFEGNPYLSGLATAAGLSTSSFHVTEFR